MLRRSMLKVLVVAVVCVAVLGCGKTEKSGKRRIAVIPKGTTHDFWKSVKAGALKAGEEFDVEIVWTGPANEEDREKQVQLVDSLAGTVQGICLAPIDRTSMVPPVVRAKQGGVPTVIFDSGLEDSSAIVSYVATDNYKGGQMAGEHLAKLLGGKGNVVLLRYAAGSESTEQREQGFLDAIAKHGEIKVLVENRRAGSGAEKALQESGSILQANQGNVDGVFTVCEPNNKGMLRALENAKLAGQIKFVGFDSDPQFVKAMKDGSMHGIILQDPFHMGYQAVKTMVEHLDGKKVEPVITTGEYLATPENMDEPRMKELLSPPKAE